MSTDKTINSPSTLLSDYQFFIRKLPSYFNGANINLGQSNPNSILYTILTNYKLLYAIFVFVCFVYAMVLQSSDYSVIVLQIWTTAAVLQLITRGVNGVVHLNDMNELLGWYRNLYSPVENPDFQVVINEHLEKQNYFIKLIMKFIPKITIIAGIIYIGQPLIYRTRTLPTPIVWNGVSQEEFSWPVYLFLYAALTYSTYNVVLSIMGSDCFFAITAIILGHRYATIGGLLKLLNYSGQRNRKKDQEIIKCCYLMHLDVMKKVNTFLDYFNLYGLFHFMSPILVNTVLSYFLNKNGFDLMSVSIIFAMSSQIAVVCFFGQVLSEFANTFSQSIYQLDWYNLEVAEQKSLLLMYMRSQGTISIKAGHLYQLNFPMMTKVFKFQASFYAFLKTM